MYRGIVFENNIDHVIVLTKDSQYLKLRKKGEIKIGKEIIFLDDDIIKENKKSNQIFRAIAAVFIILILSSTLIFQFGIDFIENIQTYAIVSLDINPSLQFEINKKEIVKKVVPLNEDGKNIIDDKMIGMTIEDAVLLGVENAIEKEYINEQNNVILITDVVKKNNDDIKLNLQEEITVSIEDKVNEEVELIYLSSNKESIKKAKDNKMSVGKYEMYKIISEKNAEAEINEIGHKSITAIINENKEVFKDRKIQLKNKEKDKNNKGLEKKEEKGTVKDKKEEEKEIRKQEKENQKENKEKSKEEKREEKAEGKENKKEIEDKRNTREDQGRENSGKDRDDKGNEGKKDIDNRGKNDNKEDDKEKIDRESNNRGNSNNDNSSKDKEKVSKDNEAQNNESNNQRTSFRGKVFSFFID